MDFDTFKRDRKTFLAATRALEIVSEAARRLPEELRARHPDLPWRAIMAQATSIAITTTTSPTKQYGTPFTPNFRHLPLSSPKKSPSLVRQTFAAYGVW